ncbi:MAG TPA: nucleoside triphosphate pyrophosphohydrolase [Candidatus Binatia bacterium]
MTEPRRTFADLVAILHRLRSPGGCPWDAEQTHETLRPYLVEETYEVLEAIDAADDGELRDELGDVLLQVVFHSELAAERAAFTIDDVVENICAKLVRRHPHVFGDVTVTGSTEVERNWTAIKKIERDAKKLRDRGAGAAGGPDRGAGAAEEKKQDESSAIDGVPRALPGLIRAHRIGEKAASVGFDWTCAGDVRRKVDEELAEIDAALADGDTEAAGEEIGDLLLTIASWARHLDVHAELTLEKALAKFSARFRQVEADFRSRGKDPASCSADELDEAWELAKARLRKTSAAS